MTTPFNRAFLLLPRARQSAVTLAATLLVVAAVVTFLSLAAYMTSQFGRFNGRQQTVDMRAAYADAAMEFAFATWKKAVAKSSAGGSQGVPSGKELNDAITAGLPSFKATIFPYDKQLSIDASNDRVEIYIDQVDQNGLNKKNVTNTAAVKPVIPDSDLDDPAIAPSKMPTNNVPKYPGWTGFTSNYVATVKVLSNGYGMFGSGEPYQARRYFQVINMPLCQNLGFYQGNMEIHPGATMILDGKIHSNQNVYAQGFNAYLQFKNNVSYSDTFYDGKSNPAVTKGWDGNNSSKNNPDSSSAVYPVLYKDALPQKATPGLVYAVPGTTTNKALPASSEFANQVNQVAPVDPFGGQSSNDNGLRDIIEMPKTGSEATAIAYNNAALFIEVDTTGLAVTAKTIPAANVTIKVDDGTGKFVSVKTSDADFTSVYKAINNGALTPMWDKRESTTAMITNLDMGLLDVAATMPKDPTKATPLQKVFNKLNADGTYTQGGTVYIHDKAIKTVATRPAIRLTNGRDIGQNVSIASDNGVYIQGDYNTGGSVYTDVPTNLTGNSRGSSPQATNYSRYASAVMADAVTILSNNWKDGNASSGIDTRTAIPTTVNIAILAGDVASNTGNNGIASGGLHNFPRFLENWKNVNFTYFGSLIQAFNSEQYTGVWKTGDVYYWPNRLWSFDTNFLVTQPPGMPQGVLLTRGRWERFFGEYNKNNG